jgi:hypothetical protein
MEDSRRLIDLALGGVRPARTPMFDLLCNDRVIEYFAGQPLNGTNDRATIFIALSRAVDGTRSLSTPNIEGSTWCDAMGNAIEAGRWTTWVRRHALQDIDQWVSWIKQNIEDLESEEMPSENQITQTKKRQVDHNAKLGGTVYVHCTPSTSVNTAMFGYHCGLDNFSYLWFDHRDLVLRWMKAIEADQLRGIEQTGHAPNCPMAMIYSDIAFKERLMFSKEMFMELGFFDNVSKICDACHKKGLKVIFHSDGYVMDIMPDLISAGIDGFNPIEKAAGMDIYELRRIYPTLILVGGVDVTHLLPNGTVDDVKAETRRIIDEVGSEGHLLIGSTTELDNNVPLENYRAYYDEVMKG